MRDFHTHDPDTPLRALISTTNDALPGKLCSLQFHPWDLPENFSLLPPDFAVRAAGYAAIGEAGLDKLHGAPPEVQINALRQIFAAARQLNKPVVCHVVKMYEEFFAIRKEFPEVKVMLHGFRGKAEMLTRLWRSDVTVSFHPDLINRREILQMLKTPGGSFGFESDDKKVDLQAVITTAARLSGNPDLEAISDKNFENFIL
jgi:TatD DNase family protein